MHTRLIFFLLLLLLLLPIIHVSAQTYRIDSLKKELPAFRGSERVNYLNALASEFIFDFVHSDSALKYTKLAWEYASAIHYNSGQAASLLMQGDVQGGLLGNIDLMNRYSKAAIDLLKGENDPENLSKAYYTLAIAYGIRGSYDSARNAALRARQIATGTKNKLRLAWSLQASGYIYCKSGEYWRSFENLIESQRMGKELNDSLLTSTSLAFIGQVFNRAGDPQKSLDYYYQSLQYATAFLLLWPHLEDMAYAHLQLKNYDSVLHYQQKHRHNLDSLTTDVLVRKKFGSFLWGYSTDVQLARKEYDKLLADILPQLQPLRKKGDVFPLMRSLLTMGKVYQAKKKL